MVSHLILGVSYYLLSYFTDVTYAWKGQQICPNGRAGISKRVFRLGEVGLGPGTEFQEQSEHSRQKGA